MHKITFLVLMSALGLVLALSGERVRAAPSALTSFVVSNPVCVQTPANGACYIELRSVTAAGGLGDSFERLQVSINGKLRVNMTGFFENSAYLYPRMLKNGLKVACGRPNASGNPNFGNLYSVTVTANVFGSAASTDIAQVYCPYFEAKTYLPTVKR